MNMSAMMGQQLASLQHTLNLSILKSQMASQTALVTTMLEDMNDSQPVAEAPHPTLGKVVDIKA